MTTHQPSLASAPTPAEPAKTRLTATGEEPSRGAVLRLAWVVFAGGGILMALEILASRILAPHFGNSVYVWGSIISVFLAALSIGYAIGGRLADQRPTAAGLGRQVVWAALAQGVIVLTAAPGAAWFGDLTGGSASGTLLAATALFGPASVLLGIISPYAVRLAASDLARLGGTAGRLYALSTAGSLLGTLGCTFVLVPRLTLPHALALLLGATAVTGLIALAGSYREQFLAATLAVGLLVLAVTQGLAVHEPGEGLLYERMTPYQTLRVREAGGVRYLESDRVLHSGLDLETGEPSLNYIRMASAALLLDEELESMLVLGMGAGHAGLYLQQHRPQIDVEFVDIDPAVRDVAERFFDFSETPRARVHIADGRRFLDSEDRRWDYIYCDTYIGLSVPFHLTTREFLELVRERLEPQGVFGLNLAGSLDRPFPRAIYRTVLEIFPSAWAFRVPNSGNLVILATNDPNLDLDTRELARRAAALDERYQLSPQLTELVGRRVRGEIDFRDVPVLTDRFAPVDRLLHLGDTEADIPTG